MALDIAGIQARGQQVTPFQRTMQGFDRGREQVAAQQEAEAVQQAEAAKLERQTAARAALTGLASNPAATGRDFANVMLQFPELGEQIQKPFDLLNTEQKEISKREALNVFAALESGQVEVAKGLLENQLEAAVNSGDEQEIAEAQAMLKILEADPDSAKAAFGLQLAGTMGEGEFDSTLAELRQRDEQIRLGEIQLEKASADLGFTKAQTDKILADTKGLETATKIAALELTALEEGNVPIDPEKKFDFEDKLRDEFTKFTADARAIEDAVVNIRNTPSTGAGDISLITAFMKMIDPGSTVREGEFATAENAAGVPGKIRNMWNKLTQGDKLDDTARGEVRDAAEVLFKNSRDRINKEKKRLGPVIKSYQLNSENVFGPRVESVQAEVVEPTGPQTIGRFKVTAK